MRNRIKITREVLFVILTFFCNSCRFGMDFNPKLINIKNKSQRNIVIYVSPDSSYYDKTLFYLNGSPTVTPNITCEFNSAAPDTFFLFFFDNDSVVANIKKKTLQGIVQRSFLGKYELYRTNINEKDTIVFKGLSIDYIHQNTK